MAHPALLQAAGLNLTDYGIGLHPTVWFLGHAFVESGFPRSGGTQATSSRQATCLAMRAVVERTPDDFPWDPLVNCIASESLALPQRKSVERETVCCTNMMLMPDFGIELLHFMMHMAKVMFLSFVKSIIYSFHGRLGLANGRKTDVVVVVLVKIRARRLHRSWMLILPIGGSNGWMPTMNLLMFTRYIWLRNLPGMAHGSVASVQDVVSTIFGANLIHFLQCRVWRFQANLCHGGFFCLHFWLPTRAWWRIIIEHDTEYDSDTCCKFQTGLLNNFLLLENYRLHYVHPPSLIPSFVKFSNIRVSN